MGRVHARRDTGAALIMVLGILGLTLVLVITFWTLTSIERRASFNYREAERAHFLALSGLERAKFELRRAVTTPGYLVPWLLYEAGNDNPPEIESSRQPSFVMPLTPLPAVLAASATIPAPSGVLGRKYFTDKTNP